MHETQTTTRMSWQLLPVEDRHVQSDLHHWHQHSHQTLVGLAVTATQLREQMSAAKQRLSRLSEDHSSADLLPKIDRMSSDLLDMIGNLSIDYEPC